MQESIKDLISGINEGKTPPYLHNSGPFSPGKDPVFYSGPFWDEEEIGAMLSSILTGKWLSSGEKVHKFEIEFSKKFKQSKSVMVNSGSSANLVMVGAVKKALKWKDGDEIIVSPVGFPTTIAPLVQNNLKPVFVDIEFETLNFDLKEVEKKITPKTKAIFISPVLGNPPDFDVLLRLKDEYGVELLLDNCDSLGSSWRGKFLNEYAVASSCSFYPAHHICTAEGGMVSSNNVEIVKIARSLAWWGRDCYCVGSANLLSCGTCGNRFDKWLDGFDGVIDHKYIFPHMGYNLKPLDLQGALGLVQLKKFEEIHKRRTNNHLKLFNTIELLPHISNVAPLPESDTSWFGVPIICESGATKRGLVKHLEGAKVQTRNYFAGNILLHPGYKDLDNYLEYPNANQVLDKVFFLGCSPTISEEMLDYIITILQSFSYEKI
mgnify:CR=1 FL=1